MRNAAPWAVEKAHALFFFQILPLTCAAVENTRVENNWKQEIEVMISAPFESINCSAPIALGTPMSIFREMRLNDARKTLYSKAHIGATGIQGGAQEFYQRRNI